MGRADTARHRQIAQAFAGGVPGMQLQDVGCREEAGHIHHLENRSGSDTNGGILAHNGVRSNTLGLKATEARRPRPSERLVDIADSTPDRLAPAADVDVGLPSQVRLDDLIRLVTGGTP